MRDGYDSARGRIAAGRSAAGDATLWPDADTTLHAGTDADNAGTDPANAACASNGNPAHAGHAAVAVAAPLLFGPAKPLQVEAVLIVELDAFLFQQALLEGIAPIA